ncbi:Histone acetyltransferase of the MYST family 1 [Capsicum annuum]|nr:Histone acetyltransferase of the MYST family 1 [Capsicum annuum]
MAMLSPKKLIKMARRWRKFAAMQRRRISFPRNGSSADGYSTSSSSTVEKGNFVVYTIDQRRYVFPLAYLENETIVQLLNMSEEEFGLPSGGPITLPCDSGFMDYIISLIKKGVADGVLHRALFLSIPSFSSNIFTRIMSLESTKEVWDYLNTEYKGDERIRGMQVLNLVLVTTPERFEATITTLENTKDFSKITFAELLSAFQAQEQWCVMRHRGTIEGALPAKHHNDRRSKKKGNNKHQPTDGEGAMHSNKNKTGGFKRNYPPCKHCGKLEHAPFKCWERPDAKCNKCNQLGHESIICNNKTQQQDVEDRVVDEQEEYQLFVASCLTSSVSSDSWLIDSGCTNHMTCNEDLFKDLSPTNVTKFRIGHGGYIPAKGMGTIKFEKQSGTKTIYDVLYVPNLDQNLLSVDAATLSEELAETPPKDDGILELSSEDSEDDDFNPDNPDKDESVKTESSSSDFTSDSEDFTLIVDTEFNRRLDEWVKIEHLDLNSVYTIVDEKVEDKDHEELDAASLREHEEFTKVKNIATIEFGIYEIETWYFSPFPPEYNDFSKLFFCEFCLNFMKSKEQLQRHMRKCDLKHPPGEEICRSGTLSVFEVDGKKNKVYWQNICYWAKLFLDHKTLYYDVNLFIFYVLRECDDRGFHMVGYISKEKHSEEFYHLDCIMTLPPY